MATDYDIKNGYHEKLKQMIQTVFSRRADQFDQRRDQRRYGAGRLARLSAMCYAIHPDFCVVCLG
jgi:hypothetical protein